VVADKGLWYYGWTYHRFLDPGIKTVREAALNLVTQGSSVLDIACGTGQLCFALKGRKDCRVAGVDLSLRMLRFAEKSNPYDDISFIHLDATDLAGIGADSFDYATMLLLMHELPSEQQSRALGEAVRVAGKVIIIDANVPLPRNFNGMEIRIVEATFGRDHNHHFKSFLANGGINGIMERSRLPVTVVHRSPFLHKCREVVMLSKP